MDTKSLNNLKCYKKIPIYVVEEHNDALQFIYAAIGGKRLPVEGTTLVHFDAHPDMLIDRKLKGSEARSGRQLLPLLQIENWIVPAAAAGHIDRVVWLRPPWAKQFSDGTRTIYVGDHPETGLLRVNCIEPYYLSDALYSPQLVNERCFSYTVAELNTNKGEKKIEELAQRLQICEPYVLDLDLDFFSTGNPFLHLFEDINLYDRLEPIFGYDIPSNYDKNNIETFCRSRESQLQELEMLFNYLELHDNLQEYKGPKSQLFEKVGIVIFHS